MRRNCLLSIVIIGILFFVRAGICSAQDFTLNDLFRIGMQNSNQVKISAENVAISEMEKRKAFSVLVPRLTAFGSFTQFSSSSSLELGGLLAVAQPNNQTSWGMRLDQTITANGREVTAFNMAKTAIEKNHFDHQVIREDYLLIIARAYYDVLRAQRAVDIAEVNLKRLKSYRDASETRVKVGEATKTVLLRAEGELSGAQSDKIKAQNALELARAVLVRIAGIPVGFALKEETYDIPAGVNYDVLHNRALEQRVELKSLEKQKQISRDQLRYAKGAYWPQITLSAVYNGLDQSPMGVLFVKESKYVGAAINFPLFEGGLRHADVREAGSRLNQTELAYRDTIQGIDVDVRNAYLDLETQRGILAFLQDQLRYAQDNYNAVSRQFKFGLASNLDLLDANNLLLSTERQLADATYNCQFAILKLKRVTGDLKEPAPADNRYNLKAAQP